LIAKNAPDIDAACPKHGRIFRIALLLQFFPTSKMASEASRPGEAPPDLQNVNLGQIWRSPPELSTGLGQLMPSKSSNPYQSRLSRLLDYVVIA
jgi:hypothetical protein